jgi:hypothetical protein
MILGENTKVGLHKKLRVFKHRLTYSRKPNMLPVARILNINNNYSIYNLEFNNQLTIFVK